MESLLEYDSVSDTEENLENRSGKGDVYGIIHSGKKHQTVDLEVSKRTNRSDDSSKDGNGNSSVEVDYFNLLQSKYESNDSSTIWDLHSDADYREIWREPYRNRTWEQTDDACSVSFHRNSLHPASPDISLQSKPTNKTQKRKDDDTVVVPYKSKRRRPVEAGSSDDSKSSNGLLHSVSAMQNSEKAPPRSQFYVVHSKIQPYLCAADAVSNRVPRKAIKKLCGHSGTVNRVRWCTREYSHLLLSASMDKTIKLWNVFSSADPCVQTLSSHWKGVKDIDWATSGRQFVSGGFDRTARVFNVESGTELFKCEHDSFVTCVKYHPVENNLFIAGSLNLLKCWDVRSPGRPVRSYTFKDKIGQIQDICFLDDGKMFLSCGDLVARDSADRNIMAWDFRSSAVISNQIYHERYVCTRLCRHPHLPQVLAQSHGNYIAQFDAVPPFKMNKCKRFEGHNAFGYDVGCDVSPDGRIVSTGGATGEMFFYDFQSAKLLSRISIANTSDVVLNVVWHPLLFSTVATSAWNGVVEIWQ